MKRFAFMMVLVLAALGAAGTCIYCFWKTSLRLANEKESLRKGFEAECAELKTLISSRDTEIAAKDIELKQIADSKESLARNLLGAMKSCDKLQAQIRQLAEEKASLEKTLQEERRVAREKAKEEAALTAAREEAERKALDKSELTDLIKLTDQAPRKISEH